MSSRNENMDKVLVVLGGLAIVVLLWARNHFLIREEVEINAGPTREAQHNDFFAAQGLLKIYGIESQISFSPSILDSMQVKGQRIEPEDTIILIRGRGILNDDKFENVWRWVESGGSFITSIENPFIGMDASEDKLFESLGVDVIDNANFDYTFEDALDEYGEELIDYFEDFDTYLDRAKALCAKDQSVDIMYPDEAGAFSVDFGETSYFNLSDTHPEVFAGYDEDYIFAKFDVGLGSIAVNASNNLWTNTEIVCHDNAYLLKKLVNSRGKVWILVNNDSPSLAGLVWAAMPLGVAAAVLTLLFWLWSRIVRFGPVFPEASLSRRSFAEHISANAAFIWRFKLQEELIEQLRKDVLHKMNRRISGFDELPREKQLSELAHICEMNTESIDYVCFLPATEVHRKEFVEMIKKLKKIKERL